MYNTTFNQPQQNNSYMQAYLGNRPFYQAPTTQPYMGLKGRPVASMEEARASIIDFDGSIFYFPDLANQRIYTKQINVDGTALLSMYELKEIPIEGDVNNIEYITRAEFEAAIDSLRGALQPASAQEKPSAQSNFSLNF